MADEERERRRLIVEQARKTVERTAEVAEADALALVMARPITSRADRDRDECGAMAQRIAQATTDRKQRAQRSAPGTVTAEMLEARIVSERAFVMECVGTAVAELLREEHAANNSDFGDQVAQLRKEVTALVEVIVDLTKITAAEQSKSGAEVVHLPRRVN